MRKLTTEIVIDRRADVVWKTLMNFKDYPHWNPFITRISGKGLPGDKMKIELSMGSEKKFKFRPRVVERVENVSFGWRGNLIVPLFGVKNSFQLPRFWRTSRNSRRR